MTTLLATVAALGRPSLAPLPVVATVSVLMLRATAEAFRAYSDERSVSDAQNIAGQVGVETGSQVFVVGGQGEGQAVLAEHPARPGMSAFGQVAGAGGPGAFVVSTGWLLSPHNPSPDSCRPTGRIP